MKTPRIVEVMEKKQLVYDVINFFKRKETLTNTDNDGKTTNLDVDGSK